MSDTGSKESGGFLDILFTPFKILTDTAQEMFKTATEVFTSAVGTFGKAASESMSAMASSMFGGDPPSSSSV